MKYLAPSLALVLLATSPISAQQTLDSKTRAETLQWLENYKIRIAGDKNKRINAAQLALASAASSEAAALNLFKTAKREVEFKKRGKNETESNSLALEWERNQRDLFNQPGFKKALQLQCAWILMGLKAAIAEKNEKPINVSQDVLTILNTIASSPELIQQKEVFQTGNIIKQALYIQDMKPEKWVDTPTGLGEIFDNIILPVYEERKDINNFRNMWNRRIELEKTINIEPRKKAEIEKTSRATRNDRNKRNNGNDRDKKKTTSGITGARAGQDLKDAGTDLHEETRKVLQDRSAEELTSLKWQMETACFLLGDERRSTANLKDLITLTKNPLLIEQRVKDLASLLEGTYLTNQPGSKADQGDPTNAATAASAEQTPAPATPTDGFNQYYDPNQAPQQPAPTDTTEGSGPPLNSPSVSPAPQEENNNSGDDWDL